jgi:glyceraldehyde-3-phosphate dehydrogenase (NADP+) (phosphorylating)
MAAHAALAATRIPTSARLHSRAASKQRVDFADFSGLRPGSCSVSAAAREASFSDVLGAQLVARVRTFFGTQNCIWVFVHDVS